MLRRMPTRLGTEQNEICELDEIRKKMRVKYEMEDVPSAGADPTAVSDAKATKGLSSTGTVPAPTRHQRLGLNRPTTAAAAVAGSAEQTGHSLRE